MEVGDRTTEAALHKNPVSRPSIFVAAAASASLVFVVVVVVVVAAAASLAVELVAVCSLHSDFWSAASTLAALYRSQTSGTATGASSLHQGAFQTATALAD